MSDEILPVSMDAIDQLADALSKAQRSMKHAEKSRENPHFKSSYATLADVIDACREPLADNGLSYVQKVSSEQGCVIVETVLMHKSGQSISATLTLPSKYDAQGIGSALTYARRYGLAAMVGVAPDEDDDGNNAGKGSEIPARQQRAPYTPRDQQRTEPRAAAPAAGPFEYDGTEVDALLVSTFKEIQAILPEAKVGTQREAAGFKAAGPLTVAQRNTFLRSMRQKLKSLQSALEGDPPPVEEDDIPF